MGSTSKGVTYDSDGNMERCLFCDICTRKAPGKILFEDQNYVVFLNIYPVTPNHALVAPKKHIKSFKELYGKDGAVTLEDMMKVSLVSQFIRSASILILPLYLIDR